MTELNNNQEIESQGIFNVIKLTIANLDEAYERSLKNTQILGFDRDVLKQIYKNFEVINENKNEHPEVIPLMHSAYAQVAIINLEVEKINTIQEESYPNIYGFSGSILTTCSTSGSVAIALNTEFDYTIDTPSFMQADANKVETILHKLDPSLANTYKEIEQIYYGTDADRVRAANSSMRQTFDHFFEKLAPDDVVRKSKYWKPKPKEKNPDLVTRRERILYAINTHVKTPSRATSLMQEMKVIIDAYKALNSLHKRGAVNINSAKKALFTVKHYIEEFANEIDE